MLCDTKAKKVCTNINNLLQQPHIAFTKGKVSMVTANGLLHSLELCSCPDADERFTQTHSIWVKPQEMEYVCDFDTVVKGSHFKMDFRRLHLHGVCMVHVPSQNIILLIGDKNSGEIWKYDIDSKLWTSTGVDFLDVAFSAVLTASENYVVIGSEADSSGEGLYVLHIGDPDNYSLHRCAIEGPKWGSLGSRGPDLDDTRKNTMQPGSHNNT